LALGRWAFCFSTVQPSSTGFTWRSAMAGSLLWEDCGTAPERLCRSGGSPSRDG
jgi:hypothetical protein